MKSVTTRLSTVAGLLMVASSASLAEGDAWYVAGTFGASFANDSDNTQLGVTVTSELDTGAILSGAFGRTFGGIRAEGELAVIVNEISALKAGGVSAPASGDMSAVALMANVYYDFDTNSKWKPFIGGGVGYADVAINDLVSMGLAIADDNAGAFAYQAKAGVGYAFTDALDGTLGYRFFGTTSVDMVDAGGTPFTSDGLQTHVIEVGVRYRF